jgi:ParB family chromosome partitioning protein
MKIENAKLRDPGVLNRKPNVGSRISILSESKRYEVCHINVENLIPYHKQARKIFDNSELNSLAETIKVHGIRQPLTVIRSKSDTSKFEVISGERRLRASKIVGLKNIPCIIFESFEQAEEVALIENIQRSDLHPLELSSALKLLLSKSGWGSQTELSKKIGLSNSQISELLKLNDLSDFVKEVMLSTNFRGRENLRKLFKIENDSGKIEYIKSFSTEKAKENQVSTNRRSLSILRISMANNSFRIQKSAIRALSLEEKQNLKKELMNIIEEIL